MMRSHPIVRWPDPVLTTPAQPVQAFDRTLWDLLEDMVLSMSAAQGIGLAAPQIGVPLRVAVALDRRRPRHRTVEMVNLRVEPAPGATRVSVKEGCLSIPGEWHRVERYPRVVATYQDRHGETHVEEVEGGECSFAHVLQHEAEHLDGVLFDHIDHIASMRTRERIRQARPAGSGRSGRTARPRSEPGRPGSTLPSALLQGGRGRDARAERGPLMEVRVILVVDHGAERLVHLVRTFRRSPELVLALERVEAERARRELEEATIARVAEVSDRALELVELLRVPELEPEPRRPRPRWPDAPRRQHPPTQARSRTAYHPAPRRPGFRGARPR
jgi:peptide deformylase